LFFSGKKVGGMGGGRYGGMVRGGKVASEVENRIRKNKVSR